MAESTREQATGQLFDSLIERQASWFDSVRAAADRYHRFNHSIIEGARQSNAEWAEVGKRWITNPTDVTSIYEAIADAIGNLRARNIALAREWFEDRVEAQRETREMVRQGFGDVREAVERAQAGAPEFLRNWGRRENGRGEPAASAKK
jgi:hypothetical protein